MKASQYFVPDPCKHKQKKLCPCDYNKCNMTRIFVDANFILAPLLEEKGAEISQPILDKQRESNIIVISNDIFGEVCNRLFEELIKEEIEKKVKNKKITIPRAESILNKFITLSRTFIITDIPYTDPKFLGILANINKSQRLACGITDQLHCSMALFLNLPFYTFDKDIKDDKDTINNNIKEIIDNKLILKLK